MWCNYRHHHERLTNPRCLGAKLSLCQLPTGWLMRKVFHTFITTIVCGKTMGSGISNRSHDTFSRKQITEQNGYHCLDPTAPGYWSVMAPGGVGCSRWRVSNDSSVGWREARFACANLSKTHVILAEKKWFYLFFWLLGVLIKETEIMFHAWLQRWI